MKTIRKLPFLAFANVYGPMFKIDHSLAKRIPTLTSGRTITVDIEYGDGVKDKEGQIANAIRDIDGV